MRRGVIEMRAWQKWAVGYPVAIVILIILALMDGNIVGAGILYFLIIGSETVIAIYVIGLFILYCLR